MGMEACLVELAAYRGIVDVSVGGDRAGGCEGDQEMLHGDGRYVHAVVVGSLAHGLCSLQGLATMVDAIVSQPPTLRHQTLLVLPPTTDSSRLTTAK